MGLRKALFSRAAVSLSTSFSTELVPVEIVFRDAD